MAILKLEDGTLQINIKRIAQELEPLNIQLNRWVVADQPQLQSLLAQDSLNEDEKEQVLKAFDWIFSAITTNCRLSNSRFNGHASRNTQSRRAAAKFDRIHTHAEDGITLYH